MISQNTSSKLSIVSGLSMIAVVFIHAKFIMSRWASIMNGDSLMLKISSFFQYTLSENVARLAVPMFFFISGYLFFKGYDGTAQCYVQKLKKRFKSLLVPYLVWSLIWFFAYCALQRRPMISVECVKSLTITPIPFQFWFLKELIVLTLLSPLFYFLIKRLDSYIILLLLITYLVTLAEIRGILDGVLFFTTGAYFSIKRLEETSVLSKIRYQWVGFSYVLMLSISLCIWFFYEGGNYQLLNFFHKMQILAGCLIIISWIFKEDKLKETFSARFRGKAGLFFFIYAGHEPLQSFVKSFMLSLSSNPFSVFVGYLLVPILVISFLVLVYYAFSKSIPSFLNLLTGYR